MRELIWNSMLSVQMNACFWTRMGRRYCEREKWLKIFLAVTASGAVAAWSIWDHYPISWKILSALSAVVAVALPILDYSGQVQKMTKLAIVCAQLRLGYDQLWAQVDTLPPDAVSEAHAKLVQQQVALAEQESVLPDDEKLLERCWNEVLSSRGIKLSNG